jgi:7-keto-8-aminopelargonate synthetase-like enzyme
MIVYEQIFDQAIDRLHAEGRYRVFIDLLRTKGQYPNARCFAGQHGPKDITVWCSNDYLAMGQHPKGRCQSDANRSLLVRRPLTRAATQAMRFCHSASAAERRSL